MSAEKVFDTHLALWEIIEVDGQRRQSAAVAQSVERHIGNVEVTSSILVSSFFIGNNVFQIDAEWASVFFYVERDVELTRSF